jgi:hypothetical protein
MLCKLILPGSWDWQDAASSLVKVSSRGLRGDDRKQLLKRASASFVDHLSHLDIPHDVEPVHILGVGAHEGWGSNRNGDAFSEQECRDHHDTFVKFGHAYKNHVNKDPKKSYGIIKASCYHDAMKRIEMLVFLSKTAEAAKRYGGLINHSALEKLARGEDLPWSMSCLVSRDICSICNNSARTKEAYCDANTCPGGGCKTNLGRMAKDGSGRVQFVWNPKPRFFDISEVDFPAERTAYGMRMSKAASADHIPGGAELAELQGVTAPLSFSLELSGDLWSENLLRAVRTVEKMAKAEIFYRGSGANALRMPATFPTNVLNVHEEKRAGVIAALAERRILPPLFDFLETELGAEKAATLLPRVYARVPGMYVRLSDNPAEIQANPYSLLRDQMSQKTAAVSAAFEKSASLSLNVDEANRRLRLDAIQQNDRALRPIKELPEDPEAERLVLKFAAVRALAAAMTAESRDGDMFLRAAVRED